MQTSLSQETYLTILISTLLLFFFGALLVYYFFRHQRKRFEYQQEVLGLRESFNQIILKSKLEIQEQTLSHIAKELHANFSHLVSLININLTAALASNEAGIKKHIHETKRLAKQLMSDLKVLSVTMNTDHIMRTGFACALEVELQRLQNTGKYSVDYRYEGENLRLPPEKEIILYRLSQEILNNIVMHSEATKITVLLSTENSCLKLEISDNGKGFDMEEARERSVEKSSTGLLNISGRAEMINAKLIIQSANQQGTHVTVIIPIP